MLTKPVGLFIIMLALASCGNENADVAAEKKDSTIKEVAGNTSMNIREEAVSYTSNGTTLKSYITYDSANTGVRPVVLIVPEWWGLTEYPRMRAKMLAEMGYVAMAIDMYGDGKLAEDPASAQESAMPFYTNPQLAKERLDAALAKIKTVAQADTSRIVAIGYCFGGSMVLNYAKMGAPLAGVVSFHGGLEGVPPQKGTSAKFLICHGAADSFVPQQQVDAFRKSMDSAGVSYTFKTYQNATHAFTNPGATEKGAKFDMPIKYNGSADTASWNDMKAFLGSILK